MYILFTTLITSNTTTLHVCIACICCIHTCYAVLDLVHLYCEWMYVYVWMRRPDQYYERMFVCICVCMYVWMYVRVCVCMYTTSFNNSNNLNHLYYVVVDGAIESVITHTTARFWRPNVQVKRSLITLITPNNPKNPNKYVIIALNNPNNPLPLLLVLLLLL